MDKMDDLENPCDDQRDGIERCCEPSPLINLNQQHPQNGHPESDSWLLKSWHWSKPSFHQFTSFSNWSHLFSSTRGAHKTAILSQDLWPLVKTKFHQLTSLSISPNQLKPGSPTKRSAWHQGSYHLGPWANPNKSKQNADPGVKDLTILTTVKSEISSANPFRNWACLH